MIASTLHAHRALLLAGVLAAASTGAGASVSFVATGPNTYSGGHTLAAQAIFDVSGSVLSITLKNISTDTLDRPSDVLMGLFFDLAPPYTLSSPTATRSAGSSYVNLATPSSSTNLGGEWAYRYSATGLSGSTVTAKYGVSGSGLGGTFGAGDRICSACPELSSGGGSAPDGLDYGIVSNSYVANTGSGVTSTVELVRNSISFMFNVAGGSILNLGAVISNVSFQYGTALDEPRLAGVKISEPASVALLALGGLLSCRKRRAMAGSAA